MLSHTVMNIVRARLERGSNTEVVEMAQLVESLPASVQACNPRAGETEAHGSL